MPVVEGLFEEWRRGFRANENHKDTKTQTRQSFDATTKLVFLGFFVTQCLCGSSVPAPKGSDP